MMCFMHFVDTKATCCEARRGYVNFRTRGGSFNHLFCAGILLNKSNADISLYIPGISASDDACRAHFSKMLPPHIVQGITLIMLLM